MYGCVPACKGCVEAGTCPHIRTVPASSRAPRRAVVATYPRDVRPVYLHLACGHVTTKEAQVFFSVWRGSEDLYCEVCHGWVRAQVTVRTDPEGLF